MKKFTSGLKEILCSVASFLLWAEWSNIFKKAAGNVDSEALKPFYRVLSKKPGLLRFFSRVFEKDASFPSTKDFAVSLAFELKEMGVPIQDIRLVTFGHFLRSMLSASFALKFHNFIFSENWGFNPDMTDELANELVSIFQNPIELNRHYFKSYGSESGKDQINVYLPNERGSVQISDGLMERINLDRLKGVEPGFFRLGFEYALYKNPTEIYSLQSAHRGNNKREFGFFGINDARPENVRQQDLLWIH